MFRSSCLAGVMAATVAGLAACIGPHAMVRVPGPNPCPATDDTAAAALDWWTPASDGDRRSLQAWCAAIGPAVVDTIPERSAFRQPGTGSLAVLVWNVSAGGGDLVAFLEAEAGIACETDSPSQAPPFVLLAQEAFRRSPTVPPAPPGAAISEAAAERPRPTPREDVVAVAERCGLALVYAPAVRNGAAEFDDGREDRGNAILANVPLHDPIVIELPAEDSRRIGLAATVRQPSGDSLRVVSLHLTLLPKLWRNLTTGNAARVRHALGFLDALAGIEASRGSEIATIAAGDVNTWSNQDAALRRLREAFPDSPAPVREGTRGPFPADHLFFRRDPARRGGIVDHDSFRRVPLDYGSDHHPLIAAYHPAR